MQIKEIKKRNVMDIKLRNVMEWFESTQICIFFLFHFVCLLYTIGLKHFRHPVNAYFRSTVAHNCHGKRNNLTAKRITGSKNVFAGPPELPNCIFAQLVSNRTEK